MHDRQPGANRPDWFRNAALFLALTAMALALNAWQATARRQGRVMPLDVVVGSISRPLTFLFLGASDLTAEGWIGMTRGRQLAEENTQLRARAAALEEELTRVGEEHAARLRLRELRLRPGVKSVSRVARVIALSGGEWSESVTLEAGAADGVKARDIAVAAGGVLGQVVAVTAGSATVLLITDPSAAISVRLRKSREVGVLHGLGGAACEIRALDPDAAVQEGEEVVTSGLGGIYPAGLRVGVVTAVRKDPESPGKIAAVAVAVDARRVEEVALIRAGK